MHEDWLNNVQNAVMHSNFAAVLSWKEPIEVYAYLVLNIYYTAILVACKRYHAYGPWKWPGDMKKRHIYAWILKLEQELLSIQYSQFNSTNVLNYGTTQSVSEVWDSTIAANEKFCSDQMAMMVMWHIPSVT